MKKILCLLLAMLMLLSLVACGESVDDPAANETKDDAAVSEAETSDPNFTCDLPSNLDYGNDTVGILYVNANNKADELISEKLSMEEFLTVLSSVILERGDIVLDACSVAQS